MTNISFILDSDLPNYFANCWTAANYQALNSTAESTVPLDSFAALNDAILIAWSRFIGFSIYSVVFGFSFVVSGLSLLYLLKRWRETPSHLIVTGFTFIISSYNIALFTMRAVTMAVTLQSLLCPWGNADLTSTYTLVPAYKFFFPRSRHIF